MTSLLQPVTNSSPDATRHTRHATMAGVGVYLPEGLLTNADLEVMVETSDTWIMERTGIRTRHRAGSGETAAMMGVKAARRAMQMAGVDTVGAIICATCSPDTLMPAAACFIQRELGLVGMPCFDLNAACSGYVFGLNVANSLIQTGSIDSALVIASEAMTSLVDFTDRTTCVLFGDGAGAAVLKATDAPGIRATRWGADASRADIIYIGPKQDNEDSVDALRMRGSNTFRLAVDRMVAMGEELAAAAGWKVSEVDFFIPHQANQRIIEAVGKRLGVGLDKVIINVSEVGNTSAASIPLALGDAHLSGRLKRGDKVVCIAFGAGATWGGVAMEWQLDPPAATR